MGTSGWQFKSAYSDFFMNENKKNWVSCEKLCKNCNKVFFVQRFDVQKPSKKERKCCSIICAKSLATKQKRELINEKTSKKIKIFFDKKGRKGKKSYKCITC